MFKRALSSVGRATLLHREGQGFESLSAHTVFILYHLGDLCPREESNLHQKLRSLLFYPLNYKGEIWMTRGVVERSFREEKKK